MFEEYITKRTKENWKFLFFSYLIRPLFESYNKMVNTETMQNFRDTIHYWREKMLSLTSLRQGSLTAMLQISTQTCIMDQPHKIPTEANDGAVQLCLDKEDTPMSTEPEAEKNLQSPTPSFSSQKSVPPTPSTSSNHTLLPSTAASVASTSVASTSVASTSSSSSSFSSSSSSASNSSKKASSLNNFLAPVPVDNFMVGASAASTASNIDLSFLDTYSANYNNPVKEKPAMDYMSNQNPNVSSNISDSLFWDDMQEIMFLNDPDLKDKQGNTSPIATFDLSSFDLTQFTNYETFPDSRNDDSAANSGKFLRKV